MKNFKSFLYALIALSAITIFTHNGSSTAFAGYTCPGCGSTMCEEITVAATPYSYGQLKYYCPSGHSTIYNSFYSINEATLSKTKYTYTGREIKPSVKVTDVSGAKISSNYYTVSYSNNKEVGTGKVTINFKGKYAGTLTKTFSITPAKPTLSSAKKGTCKFKAKWKKGSGISGYQLSYSANKKFDCDFKTNIKSKNKTSYTQKLNTGGIKYYVRIRSYKTINGKKIYSPWSNAKSVNVKNKSWNSMTPQEQVVALVNKERVSRKLTPLVEDSKIDKAGNLRAKEIKSYFSHTRPNGTPCFTALSKYKISYRSAGENIAAGQPDASSVVTAWMNSPGHRANILDSDFRKIGVGYHYDAGSTYRSHWVQLFTR